MTVRDIVFFADVVMPPDTFTALPDAPATPDHLITQLQSNYGRVHRVLLDREGAPAWHAIAWHNLNGSERAIACRIIVRNYRQED
jgi:hypothetical protein